MSTGIDGANPQMSDATRKIESPAIMNGFRPNISDGRPTSGIVTVEASTYAVSTQGSSENPERSASSLGVAVTVTKTELPR